MSSHEQWRKNCEKPGGPKKPYEDEADECDHDYVFDEDTAEYICHCGDRYKPDLTELM